MTPIESLYSLVRETLPDFAFELNPPTRDKPWQLICRGMDRDGQLTNYMLVVNWSSKRGFGINSNPQVMDPDEVYMDATQARTRVLEILRGRIVPTQLRTRVVDRE